MKLSRFISLILILTLPGYSAQLYVEDAADLTITTDNAPAGLSNGDIVSWPDLGGTMVDDLVFGTDAFSTITDAVAAASDGDDINLGQEEFVETGTIVVDKGLNFVGRGSNQTLVDGDSIRRIFDIAAGRHDVSFFRIGFQDGRTPGADPFDSLAQAGSAVRAQNTGTLSFDDCRIRRNRSGNGSIGIRNASAGGEVRINNCFFENNFAETFGGGVAMVAPVGSRPVVLRRLRMFGNDADEGAALYLSGASRVAMDRSDIATNDATVVAAVWISSPDIALAYSSIRENEGPESAALHLESPSAGGSAALTNLTISVNVNTGGTNGTLTNASPANLAATVSNVTVYGNTSSTGDAVFSGDFTVANTISVGNAGALSNDTSASVVDAGGNVLGLMGGLTPADVIELSSENLDGSTFIHRLVAGSPAINNGDNSLIAADLTDRDNDGDSSEPVGFDQRGPNRLRVRNTTVDSGAYEGLFEAYVARTVTVTTDVSPTGLSFGDIVTWKDGSAGAVPDLIFGAEVFTSIGDAIVAAEDGANIFIASDTYNQSSALSVRDSYTFIGDLEGATILSGLGTSRVIEARGGQGGINLVLENLTLINGQASGGSGGALRVFDGADVAVSLINCEVGQSTSADGAALSAEGGAQLEVIQSTIHDNTATASGGAIFVDASSSVSLVNATLSKNGASTGGGISVEAGGAADLKNSLVVGNTATTNTDLDGAFTSDGTNFIGELGTATGLGSDATLASTGTTVGEVIAGTAADNGGISSTFTLPIGSPAIDGGLNANIPADSADLDDDGDLAELVPYDQRGFDFPRIFGGTVDIGAFEVSNNQPVIALLGDSPMIVECGVPSFSDPGASATDVEDDDATLTAAIVVDSSAIDLVVLGEHSVTYDVTDSGGRAADTVTRTVTIVDTTVPVVTLVGDATINLQEGDSFTDPGATVGDNCDLTVTVVAGGSVNPNVPATYMLTYDATDASGNMAVQVVRTVIVGPAPSYAIAAQAPSSSEGAALLYTVSRTGSIDRAGSVDWALTLAGNLTAEDVESVSGTLNFAADEASVTLSISSVNDEIVELDEVATVTLSNPLPAPATIVAANASASSTISNDDEAAVGMTEPSVQEGDSGTVDLVFTVTLDKAVDSAFTVDYATQAETAGTEDFTAVNETVNFAGTVGESHQVTVAVTGELEVEADETFLLQSGTVGASGRAVTADSGQGTILNDDAADLAIADVISVNEGDAGTTGVTFNVTLVRSVPEGFTVDWVLPDSEDVEGASGTLTFVGLEGEVQPVVINVLGDEKVELDEVVSVTLSNLSNTDDIALTDAVGDVSILNDDSATVSLVAGTAEEGEMLSFTANLSHEVDAELVFDVSTDPETSSDFNLPGGTQITFQPGGSLSVPVIVPTTEDEVAEAEETFNASLAIAEVNGRAVTLSGATAIGTITDDDTTILSVENVAVEEGSVGTVSATFMVISSAAVDTPYSVSYSTVPVDADAADFVAATGTLNFAGTVGESQSLSVLINGDSDIERDETFQVVFTDPTPEDWAITLPSPAVGTIQNDDTTSISLADLTIEEGDTGMTEVSFSVTLAAAVPDSIQVDYDVPASGSVEAASGTLTFAGTADEVQTFTTQLAADEVVELDEVFNATISNLVGSDDVVISRSFAIGTVTDDDQAVVIVDAVSVGEADVNTEVTFDISLSKEVDVPVSLNYETEGDSATGDLDFTTVFGSLTIEPEGSSISVTILGDNLDEGNEDFVLFLDSLDASGRDVVFQGDVSTLQVAGTIIEDDAAPVAATDSYELPLEASFSVSAANGVLPNDTDADDGDDSLQVSGVGVQPLFGTVSVGSDGGFTYSPGIGFPGTDSFSYEVTDGDNTSTGVVMLTRGVAPGSKPGVPEVQPDGTVSIPVTVTPGSSYFVLFSTDLKNFETLATIVPTIEEFTFLDIRKPLESGFEKGFYVFRLIPVE